MAINKVVLNNEVWLDLTADTVTADNLLKGYTAHDKSGTSIVGTYEGGSTPSPTEDNATVIFVDYDGTLLETWTKDEVAGKTALPTPPAHEGLVFEEWNWSLADIQGDTTGQVITVAPYYHTSSGYVEIDIELNEGTGKTAYLFTQSMVGRTIDWGDGTTSNTEKAHTYENYGSYTVKVPAQSGALSRVFFESAMVIYYGKPIKAIRCNQDVTDLSHFRSMGLAVDVVLNKAFAVGSYKTNICCGKLFHKINEDSGIYNYGIEYISIKKGYTSTLFSVSINQYNKIKNIYIPSNITGIGNNAFYECQSLQSINIPDGVTSIGDYAFEGCLSLQSINIPDGVTSIGTYAFDNCYSLQSITIPSSVTSIGSYAFESCYSLQSITIPSGVTSIGNSAFYYCQLLQSINIPDGVTSIGDYAFQGCKSLQSITIPSSVTSIGRSAFYGCQSLQSITIPSSVTSIGRNAFYNCKSLQSITIPDGVTSIGTYAFYECYSLQSITIPSSVTSIGDYAFESCKSLQSITIPSSVTSIGRSAFYGCYNIRYAKINTTADIDSNTYFYSSSDYINTTYDFSEVTAIPTLSSTDGLNNSNYITAIIVPDALYDDWIATTNWATFASKIKKASEYTYG